MKYGYARASTLNQDLENQIVVLEKENCDYIYSEKFTGTKTDRLEFQKLLFKLKEGDTLIVTKLDCFARSTVDGIHTIKNLFEKGVKAVTIHAHQANILSTPKTKKYLPTVSYLCPQI